MSSSAPKVTFKYIFKYDYNPVYVNGAHGSISPRGEIVANFYLERPPLPKEMVHAVTPEGAISAEVVSVDPKDLNSMLIRYVSQGVVLNYQNALELHRWLGERIAELEHLMSVRGNKQDETTA